MNRTPLRDRVLPAYTRGEDRANMITHIVGGGLGVLTLVLCVITAALHSNVWGVVSGSIYGAALIALYSVSSVYHGLRPGMGKKVMQVIDHCTIYFLIAGTYTPVLLSCVRVEHPVVAWVIFGAEWGLAALAVVFAAIDHKKYRAFNMICYIGMGWFIILALRSTVETMGLAGFLWLLGGGVAYTVGAVLYGIGGKRPIFHTVFHVFVVIGSLLQAVSILLFCM